MQSQKLNEKEKLILNICQKNNSIVTYKDCKENQVDKNYLKRMVLKGILSKLVDGVYTNDRNTIFDEMWYLQYKNKNIVFDRIAALSAINETQFIPYRYDVAVPYNTKINRKEKLNIRQYKSNLFEIGVIEVINNFGNRIKTYNFNRVIINIIKNKDFSEFAIKAIDDFNNCEKNKLQFLDYCNKFNITKETIESRGIVING